MVENKPEDKGDSKKALKKEAKKAEKAAKKAEHKGNTAQTQQNVATEGKSYKKYIDFYGFVNNILDDISEGKYGNFPIIRSSSNSLKRTFIYVSELNKNLAGKVVWIRARLHTVRARGKQCFMVIRQREYTVQVLINVSDAVSKAMVKFCSK